MKRVLKLIKENYQDIRYAQNHGQYGKQFVRFLNEFVKRIALKHSNDLGIPLKILEEEEINKWDEEQLWKEYEKIDYSGWGKEVALDCAYDLFGQPTASGFFKDVWVFSEDRRVLKIPQTGIDEKTGIELEAQKSLQMRFASELIPRVLFYDKYGCFLLVEQVNTFEHTSRTPTMLKKCLPILDTPEFQTFINKYFSGDSHRPPFYFFQEMIKTISSRYEDEQLELRARMRRFGQDEEGLRAKEALYNEYYESTQKKKDFVNLLKKDPKANKFFQGIINLHHFGRMEEEKIEFGLWDFKLANLGWVGSEEDPRIVILDLIEQD